MGKAFEFFWNCLRKCFDSIGKIVFPGFLFFLSVPVFDHSLNMRDWIRHGIVVCGPENIEDLIDVLYPDIQTYEEMEAAIYAAYDYYISEYPQHRFKGKTAGEVRREALQAETPVAYPIPVNRKIQNFWNNIESKKAAAQTAAV